MSNLYDNVYPLDLTMSLESNYILSEEKIFSEAADRIFVPDAGPFYAESLILYDSNGTLLIPELDFKLLYLNESATVDSGRDVVTVIWILTETIPSILFEYRVVGGEYGNTVYAILQELRNGGPINRNVDWNSNVFNKPALFPAAPHYHTPETFTDWEMIYKQLEGIRTAIVGGDLPAWQAHYSYLRSLFRNLNFDNYYTKDEVDDMLNNSMLQQILDAIKEVRDCACKGTGGGGTDNAVDVPIEQFTLTSVLVGDEVVYTLTSSDPTSTQSAPYLIKERPKLNETFKVVSSVVGDSIVYDVESSDLTSTSLASYVINETSGKGGVNPLSNRNTARFNDSCESPITDPVKLMDNVSGTCTLTLLSEALTTSKYRKVKLTAPGVLDYKMVEFKITYTYKGVTHSEVTRSRLMNGECYYDISIGVYGDYLLSNITLNCKVLNSSITAPVPLNIPSYQS